MTSIVPGDGFVPFDMIPADAREVGLEVYDEEGLELWWNARNSMLPGARRPRDCHEQAVDVLHRLADGAFA